mgnify:CR=1 FL=1
MNTNKTKSRQRVFVCDWLVETVASRQNGHVTTNPVTHNPYTYVLRTCKLIHVPDGDAAEPLTTHITSDSDFENLTYTLHHNRETDDTRLFDEYGFVIGTAGNKNSVAAFTTQTRNEPPHNVNLVTLDGGVFWDALHSFFVKTRDYVQLLPDIEDNAELLSPHEVKSFLMNNLDSALDTLDEVSYYNDWQTRLNKEIMHHYAYQAIQHGDEWAVKNDRLAVLIGNAWYENQAPNTPIPEPIHDAVTRRAPDEPTETSFTGYDPVTIWRDNNSKNDGDAE